MKKILVIIFIALLSCNDQNMIEGEMYITLINVYNPKVLGSKQKIEEFKNNFPSGSTEEAKKDYIEGVAKSLYNQNCN